jgi:predicted short-subunit dehydrogenase-like oxidoreductase (DUF2520 family)
MNDVSIKTAVILGSGNLAGSLAPALKKAGVKILQVYSRNAEHAKILADEVNAPYTAALPEITMKAEVYFFLLSDSVVEKTAQKLNLGNSIAIHCSGSLPANMLKSCSANYGVFYPLQTFKKEKKISFEEIPFFIEASNNLTGEGLMHLAKLLSSKVYSMTSMQREKLHLAAVIANNFSNHLYLQAEKILAEENIPFDVLLPLLTESLTNVSALGPYSSQTGPARRNDKNIIEHQLKLLSCNPKMQMLYSILSESITDTYNNEQF